MKAIILGRYVFPIVFILISISGPSTLAGSGECFSIVVGKDVSADGNVLMAHNEDDGAPCVVNHYKVPRKQYDDGEKVVLLNGGRLDQVSETYSYIWSEMPEFLFSDSYINEFGVGIASDACPSREDQPQLTDGGISYMLRQLVAQRAKTAREGVILAGKLVERFGYDGSGRTYIICDPLEGWLFCAVNGKHWVAKRVPDSQVAAIANTYTVHHIDLTDDGNYMAAADIIDYAVSRGWYDPASDGDFDFAAVYSDPDAAINPTNTGRHWAALRLMAKDNYDFGDKLPFSFAPRKKIDPAMIMNVLRDHYEGTELYEETTQATDPHDRSFRSICRPDTRTSFVVQLRDRMPLDLGIVYWVCLGSPCASTYIPYYFGIRKFPAAYAGWPEYPSQELFEDKLKSEFQADKNEAFWTFSNFVDKMCGTAHDRAAEIIPALRSVEKHAFTTQNLLEEAMLDVYADDKDMAIEKLYNYSEQMYLSTVSKMSRALSSK